MIKSNSQHLISCIWSNAYRTFSFLLDGSSPNDFFPVDSVSLSDPERVSARRHGEYIVNRSYHRWNKNDAIARHKVWKSNVIWLSGVWGVQTYWRIFLSVCRQLVRVVAVQRDGCCTQRNILRKVRSDGPEYSDQLKNGLLRHAQNTPAEACFRTAMHSHINPCIHLQDDCQIIYGGFEILIIHY